MLDIGFSELLLIAVVALVVVGPKDLPVVIRHATKFLREMREIYAGLKQQMTAVMDEVGAADIKREMTTIIDLEGRPQQAYDVREIEALKQSSVASRQSPVASEGSTYSGVPLPLRERLGEGALNQNTSLSNPLTQPSPARKEGLPAAPVTKP